MKDMRALFLGRASLALVGMALVGMAAFAVPQAQARPAPPSEPVVIELFTAQGCAGCPEANALVEDLAGRPDVIALTYPVDYWDYLGWSDTFAQPSNAERQRAYQARLRLRDVYTPQIIIDGRRHVSGSRVSEVREAVDQEAARLVWMPHVEFRETGDRVGVGSGRAPVGGADVWLVRYQPGPLIVEVGEGENRGLEVRHANVVREIVHLGDWRGRPILLTLPEGGDPDLGAAILVQDREDGAILAAAVR